MVKIFFLFIIISFPAFANDITISLSLAKTEKDIKENMSLWSKEIKNLKSKNIKFYFSKTDLSSLGKSDVISVIQGPEVCGINNCPTKIISNNKEIFNSYIPFRNNIITIKEKKRAFYPDLIINDEIFSFHYDINKYLNKKNRSLSQQQSFIKCNSCNKDIPKNPISDSNFPKFTQEIIYEAELFNKKETYGIYGFSKMAFANINLIDKATLFDNSTELSWTKKANNLGINTNSDFLENNYIQDKIFEMYILSLHKNLSYSDICMEIDDSHSRNGKADYWGLLKNAYMLGYSKLYKDINDYNGGDYKKYILDGVALNNNCIKKIITSSNFNENMVIDANENVGIKERGKIE